MNTRVFDLGLVYNWAALSQEYRMNVIQRRSGTIYTDYERLFPAAQAALEKTLEAFERE